MRRKHSEKEHSSSSGAQFFEPQIMLSARFFPSDYSLTVRCKGTTQNWALASECGDAVPTFHFPYAKSVVV